MFAHILVDAIVTYLLLANKNTQVGTNGIQWVNMNTGKKIACPFCQNEWMLEQMFLQLVIINAYSCSSTWHVFFFIIFE
jgi:hypothetical protein